MHEMMYDFPLNTNCMNNITCLLSIDKARRYKRPWRLGQWKLATSDTIIELTISKARTKTHKRLATRR